MNATIKTNNTTISGKNLSDLRRKMNAMLSVDGYRALTSETANGTIIHVELYEGQDYIKTADGRSINLAAAALGSIKSERKAKSSAANGKKGGRPKKK